VRDVQVLPGQPDRLRVVLDEPFFAGLAAFAPAWTVVQKHYFLAEVERLARDAGRPVPVEPGDEGFGELLAMVKLPGPGSGPYQLEPDLQSGKLLWPPSRDLLLVRNSDSWRRRVCDSCWSLAGFRLLFLTDGAAVFTELLKGNLDWYSAPDPEELFREHPELRQRYATYEYDYQNLGHYWIVWNLRREPLDDVRVRQALSMLFDRKTIVNELLEGNGEVAASFFKPGTPYYPGDSVSPPYDPNRAGELLREAGLGGDGEPLRIRIVAPRSPSGFYRRVLDLARSAFNQVEEVELDVQILEWSALVDLRSRRDFDGLFYLQGHGAWVDPFPQFHSSQAGQSGQNVMGYENPEVDGILEAARGEMDEARRIELFQRFNAIIHREQPVTFLAHPRVSVLINRDIEGVEPGPLGLFPERWSVPVELQRK
jgi:peptide/nickel transport system substrate-binding protein